MDSPLANIYIFNVRAIPAPRINYHSRGNRYALTYKRWCSDLRVLAMRQGFPINGKGVVGLSVRFGFQMPKSWPAKKKIKMYNNYHQQIPDLDNLLKCVQDALFPEGDSWLAHYQKVFKVWDEKDSITVEVINE